MKLTSVEKQFESVAIVKPGVFLLRVADALRFVNQCRREGIAIAGIEGFRMIGDAIQPLQEHSNDYGDNVLETHDRSEAFLNDRLTEDLWFEVVGVDRSTQ